MHDDCRNVENVIDRFYADICVCLVGVPPGLRAICIYNPTSTLAWIGMTDAE